MNWARLPRSGMRVDKARASLLQLAREGIPSSVRDCRRLHWPCPRERRDRGDRSERYGTIWIDTERMERVMAGSVNKVILIGNLGADPEIRRTQDGRPVANLRVATSESWRDKATGERKEKTEWHRVVIFNENLCRVAEQYLKKGSKVFIEGQLQTRK